MSSGKNHWMRLIALCAIGGLATAAGGLATAAQAADLSVNPVRVTLDSPQDIGMIRMENRGSEPVVMQASVKDWSIENGTDRYRDTEQLVVTPPVFTVEPGERQVVRLGLENPSPASTKQAYRVYFEESAARPAEDGSDGADGTQVRINLRIGIPVFIAAEEAGQRYTSWQTRLDADQRLLVRGENRGNMPLRTSQVAVLDDSGAVLAEREGIAYLLAGTQREWVFDLSEIDAEPRMVRVRTEEGVVKTPLDGR